MPSPRDGSRLDRFRYEYGAEPLHLLATIASLAIALYAILRIFEIPSTAGILLWLGAAIIAHDLIALPIYSGFLRLAETSTDALVRPRRRALLTLNHIRIPAAFSLLLLLICFPLVAQIDEPRYQLTTGLGLDRYLGNWLLITAVLFGVSGLLYAIKLRAGAGRQPLLPKSDANGVPTTAEPASEPSRVAVVLSRGVLAIGALLALWVAALALYGLFASFPI